METTNRDKAGSTTTTTTIKSRDALSHKESPKEDSLVSNMEGLRHEYSEVNNNIRHYSNLRFAIFTVYFALLGGLISVAFGFFENKTGNPDYIRLWARMGGLIVTLLFWVLELNCEKYLRVFVEVAKGLEEKLSYTQITEREARRFSGILRPSYAPSVIYGSLILFWLVMLGWIIGVIVRA